MNLFPETSYAFEQSMRNANLNKLGQAVFPSDGTFTQEQIAAEFERSQAAWQDELARRATMSAEELAQQSAIQAIAAQASMQAYLQQNATQIAQAQAEIDQLGAERAALLAAERAAAEAAQQAAERAAAEAAAIEITRQAEAAAAAAQAEAEAAAMRALLEAQTEPARNYPWFEADLFANATAEQKAAAYLRYIDMGKSDSEIRAAANAFFGFQKDADWQLLQQMARDLARRIADQTLRPIVEPRRDEIEKLFVPVTPTTPTQPAGNAGAIALAALAAALLLGA